MRILDTAVNQGNKHKVKKNRVLVTGGAGFIGSNFILDWIVQGHGMVVNLDKLTYAGNLNNLASLSEDRRHVFVHGDIADKSFVQGLLGQYQPIAIVNFAAESHVDRSIHDPGTFIHTNIVGAFSLLEAAREYWDALAPGDKSQFRFLHVSTDEVYGSLSPEARAFTEQTPYAPNSPYAASKAAGDHLVRAYHRTYELPTITTNCSNNYGPYQYPEKLVPLMVLNALQNKPLPIYGDGSNIRDWLYVKDHSNAIRTVLEKGKIGDTFNIGGCSERTNLSIVHTICSILDELKPRHRGSYSELIQHVADRPGHDKRYAVGIHKIQDELGWKPKETFETGIRKTINWYLDNLAWAEGVTSRNYRNWISMNYDIREAP